MSSLRVVFMGSPDFAVPSLEVLADSEHKIVTVVSNPDKRRGRGEKPVPTDVKRRALELGLPVIDVEDTGSADFQRTLEELKPDLLVVVAFRILPKEILSIPTMGSVNLHASLLPKYRGAAPIHWAIINGEKETGCTVFFLNEKVDGGEIIGCCKTPIGGNETTGDLYGRLKILGADLLKGCVNQIAEGSTSGKIQNEQEVSKAPKLFKENTKIDFSKSAFEVHNFVRGLNPFPKAWCIYKNLKMNIYETEPDSDKRLKPGELRQMDDKLYAGCGEGSVVLKKVQLPGTKILTGEEFVNGYDTDTVLND